MEPRASLRAVYLTVVAVDAMFSIMAGFAYAVVLRLAGIEIAPGPFIGYLLLLNIVKTTVWSAVYWRMAVRLLPGAPVTELTRNTLDRLPMVVSIVFAVSWTAGYAVFSGIVASEADDGRFMIAMIPFSIAVFAASWSLLYSMMDWLLEPVGARILANCKTTSGEPKRLSLRQKVTLNGLTLTISPTAWLVSLWILWDGAGDRLEGALQWFSLFVFVVPVLYWASMVTYFLAASLGSPVAKIHRAVRQLAMDTSTPPRVNVSRRDELGMLGLHVNEASEQLVEALDALTITVYKVELALAMRDEFISVASHELNTPLTTLILQLQHAERMLNHGHIEKVPLAVRAASGQAVRLGQLVENLLDFSRISSGNLRLEYERFDVAEVAHDVARRFHLQAEKAGCRIEVRAQPIMASLDRMRVEQLLNNLLSNALKYGPGKPVTLELAAEEGRLVIRVTDHGDGISKEKQDVLFGKYERLDATQKVSGLGLGLYITKQIVEAHAGVITVESRVGGPTTFLVELPMERSLALSNA